MVPTEKHFFDATPGEHFELLARTKNKNDFNPIWLISMLISSGLVIWREYFAENTAVEQKRIAVLLHAHAMAAIVIISVWVVHVYAAIRVRDTVNAMTRGHVTDRWAWRHHDRWLRAPMVEKPASRVAMNAATLSGAARRHTTWPGGFVRFFDE